MTERSFLTRKDQDSSAQPTSCSDALSSSGESELDIPSSSSHPSAILSTPFLPLPCLCSHGSLSQLPLGLGVTGSLSSGATCRSPPPGRQLDFFTETWSVHYRAPSCLCSPPCPLFSSVDVLHSRSPLSTLFLMTIQHCPFPLLLLLPGLKLVTC